MDRDCLLLRPVVLLVAAHHELQGVHDPGRRDLLGDGLPDFLQVCQDGWQIVRVSEICAMSRIVAEFSLWEDVDTLKRVATS